MRTRGENLNTAYLQVVGSGISAIPPSEPDHDVPRSFHARGDDALPHQIEAIVVVVVGIRSVAVRSRAKDPAAAAAAAAGTTIRHNLAKAGPASGSLHDVDMSHATVSDGR